MGAVSDNKMLSEPGISQASIPTEQASTVPTEGSSSGISGMLSTLPSGEGAQSGVSGTLQTDLGFFQSFTLAESWPYLALALVLAVLAYLFVDSWRRAKRRTAIPTPEVPEAPVTAAASKHEVLPVAVARLQGIGARDEQQDSFGISELTEADYQERGLLAVVADGMGGLSNGKAVSSLLVRTCLNSFYNQRSPMTGDILLEMVTTANHQVNQMLQGKDRSGSTLVAATIQNGYLDYLTVGDSHIYLYRGGGLLLLNREHIYREELAVKAVNRAVPPYQVTADPQAKSLTSYFGIGRLPRLDRNCERIKLINGDRILLCTDGVFGTVSQQQLEQALSKPLQEAAETIERTIEAAARPYQDNYTAILLEYQT